MKKISVIISCYNASAWVRDAFNSMKNQTIGFEDIECIFVDDASNDEGATWNVLLDIERQAPDNVMLIHLDTNMRQGGARNIGMQYMTGKYMMFLDADDLYRPETCLELYELAEKNNTDIIHFQHDIVWRSMDDVTIPEREPEGEGIVCDFYERPDLRNLFLTGVLGDFGCTNKFYRADFVRKVGSTFAEHLVYEEPKFVFPLFLQIKRYMLIEAKYYIYRKHMDSTMNSELGIRLLDHPKSQLQLMEYVVSNSDIYDQFKDEIDYHFAYSYIFETLRFYVVNKGELPIDYFNEMVRIFMSMVPNIYENKYVKDNEYVKMAVEGCRALFTDQKSLQAFAQIVNQCYENTSK